MATAAAELAHDDAYVHSRKIECHEYENGCDAMNPWRRDEWQRDESCGNEGKQDAVQVGDGNRPLAKKRSCEENAGSCDDADNGLQFDGNDAAGGKLYHLADGSEDEREHGEIGNGFHQTDLIGSGGRPCDIFVCRGARKQHRGCYSG